MAANPVQPAEDAVPNRKHEAVQRPSGAWLLMGSAAGWLAGIALQIRQAELVWPGATDGSLVAATLLAGLAWFVVAWCARSIGRRSMLLLFVASAAAAAATGFCVTEWRAAIRLSDTLPAELEGADLELTGIVASLPQRSASGARWRFAVEAARRPSGEPVSVPALVSLSWFVHAGDASLSQVVLPRAGERWRLTVRLRPPHGFANPHGFDFELWLFEQGVRATGYVRSSRGAVTERLAVAAAHPVEQLRQRLRDAIETEVSDVRAAGIVAALAIGDQAAIVRGDWDIFRATGVAHLMSISGLHVTMLAWLTGGLVGRAWRRSPRAMLLWPAASAARWLGLAAAAGYALLAGWGVPAQRTVWMLAAVTLLRTAGVRWPGPAILVVAAVAVCTVDPWAMLQPGFWLSFTAVGLLLASEPAVPARSEAHAPQHAGLVGACRRLVGHLRAGLRTQVVATLGLAPLTLVLFQQVSLVGFVANLIAIPLVTLAITPIALLGALAAPFWSIAGWLVQQLAAWLSWLAAAPLAVFTVAVAPLWAQAGGLLAGALLIAPLPWRIRLLAAPLALPLLAPAPQRPPPGQFEVVAADVGQGSAVLVRTHAHALLYDAGPRYSVESDAGQRVLLPLLRALGDRRLDRLVLSHRDSDHIGGAGSLLAGVRVDAVSSSLDADQALRESPAVASWTRCESGQTWQWDGVRFDMLHPAASAYAMRLPTNAMSCVLAVTDAAGARMLLTGDIPAAQEQATINRHGEALRAVVLFAPHHGSRTSSSEPLLDAVQPRLAVVQAGWRNRFGHPAPEVLARYAQHGVRIVRTDHCGAWRWRSDDSHGRCEREASRRYWHHRPGRPGEGAAASDEPAAE